MRDVQHVLLGAQLGKDALFVLLVSEPELDLPLELVGGGDELGGGGQGLANLGQEVYELGERMSIVDEGNVQAHQEL